MKNPIMIILSKYCEIQGIELRNMKEVAIQIDNALNDLIPSIVHKIGDLVVDDEEE